MTEKLGCNRWQNEFVLSELEALCFQQLLVQFLLESAFHGLLPSLYARCCC